MSKMIHPVAGTLAILAIATFWLSTALSELFAPQAIVIAVKTAIPPLAAPMQTFPVLSCDRCRMIVAGAIGAQA